MTECGAGEGKTEYSTCTLRLGGMTISLKTAEEIDLPLVAALMNAAYRGREVGRSWTTEAGYITGERTNVGRLREEIAEGTQLLVTKDDSGALVGCVSLQLKVGERWYLGGLSIDPALQNGGVGRELLRAAEKYAAAGGAGVIEMTVINIREALISWYERRGYRRTGEVRAFPYGDDRFGVPMREDLAFVVLEKYLS